MTQNIPYCRLFFVPANRLADQSGTIVWYKLGSVNGITIMPAKYDLTWDGDHRRWRVQCQGKRYVVSTRQLRKQGFECDDTKEGSRQAANLWWSVQRSHLAAQKPEHPHQDAIDTLERRLAWAKLHEPSEVAELSERLEHVKTLDFETYEPELDGSWRAKVAAVRLFGVQVTIPDDCPPSIISYLFGNSDIWGERLSRTKHDVPVDRTISGQITLWLAKKEAQVHVGELNPARYDNLKRNIGYFRDFLGGANAVEFINAEQMERWYQYLLGRISNDTEKQPRWSRAYADTLMVTSRTFVRYLHEKDLIALPKNLRSLTIKVTEQKVKTFDDQEVKALLENATGQLKLHLLLAMNCGYRSKDIASIRDQEVDWVEGTITRKRTKTADNENTPEVTYTLWSETFRLLEEWRSGQDTVLLTKSGRPWVWEALVDGKLRSTDTIATNYRRLAKSLKISKPMALLRKTSSTKLKNSKDFSDLDWYFLGHAGRSVADRHYSAILQDRLAKALHWLGGEYGLV